MNKLVVALWPLLLAALTCPASAGAIDTLFDVINGEIICSGPPYPTPALRVALAHQTTGESELDGELSLRLGDATDAEQTDLCLGLVAEDTESPWSDFTTVSCFEVLACDEPNAPLWPERSAVTTSMHYLSEDGVPAELVMLRPELAVSDERRFFRVTADQNSFRVTCRTEFVRGLGHQLTLSGALGRGLALDGLEISLLRNATDPRSTSEPILESSFFTDRAAAIFDVVADIRRIADVVPEGSILSLRLEGQFLGAPSPVEDASWASIKSLFLN